ncbi:MAG: hypothetical protein M1826_003732 [Phylliscum demangeonii]|nr:MAG: hypothetical protein M1826_003732 [Phylliscum demangeonii]
MNDRASSPVRPASIRSRTGHLHSFGALNSASTESVLSTRGQSLLGLIRSRSSASLHISPSKRHRPSTRSEEYLDGLRKSRAAAAAPDEAADERATGGRENGGVAPRPTPVSRSGRLIGTSDARYNWEAHVKSEAELKRMKKPLRQYYERSNRLVQQYMYIDRLLDSPLPQTLIDEYHYASALDVPRTIDEEEPVLNDSRHEEAPRDGHIPSDGHPKSSNTASIKKLMRLKRRPAKDLYRPPPDEETALLANGGKHGRARPEQEDDGWSADNDDDDDDDDQEQSMVRVAIYVNLAANTVLLAAKIAATALTSSLSVLASLVDSVLDFLSTAIVWATTVLMARHDRHSYPIGRQRLEPIGVLVFSVIMVTSFFQVLLESVSRLRASGDHSIVRLTVPSTAIMASTVLVKLGCWFWCRLIHSSSVQALAQDAMTDVVFNFFSIVFPLLGFYAGIWWLDALGGALLSLYVIAVWTRTSTRHIRHLIGAAATAEQRSVLLYLTTRFADAVQAVQALQAYHAGDRLIVELDLVLHDQTPLRDSHDLGECLQYMLESVPFVDRAFVHLDYRRNGPPSHRS